MAIIPEDVSNGEDINDGTTALYSIDNSGDPVSGGSYSHNPKLCSATALAQYRDFVAYLKTLDLETLPTHKALTTTAHGGIIADTDARLTDARIPTAHALVNNTGHTVSGLTVGHVLTALTATTVGFAQSDGGNPSADLTATGVSTSETVGETVVFGNLLYLKSDGKWWKASNAAATTMPAIRIALATISANASGLMLKSGRIRNDAWNWTIGGKIYTSTSAGITQTIPSASGSQIQIIGYAYSADAFEFIPTMITGEAL